MLKKVMFVLTLLLLAITQASGQFISKAKVDMQAFESIPQEKVFLHFNTTLLFPAEYLYYKFYCFDSGTGHYSNLSKIGYVELIDENKKVVFKHKIRLLDGVGQGDFFVPASLPSGNYKLIAYTNWMKNFTEGQYFENDISVINPYRSSQIEILSASAQQVDSLIDSSAVKIPKKVKTSFSPSADIGPISVFTDSREYGKRAKVSVNFEVSEKRNIPLGSYSISVRQIGRFPQHSYQNSEDLIKNAPISKSTFNVHPELFLPEVRGELLYGKLVAKKEGISAAYQNVAVSLPGQDFQFKIAKTNADGQFYINLDKEYAATELVVHVLGYYGDQLEVHLNEHQSVDYSKIKFKKFRIDSDMQEAILERSIHNQIESAYFGLKPDSILASKYVFPFSEQKMHEYLLADYSDFKTVREAILEIVRDVSVRRNSIKKEVVEVNVKLNGSSNLIFPPLILVDGIFVEEHAELLKYDARKLRSIKVLKENFVFGPKIYQGAVVFETTNSDFSSEIEGPNIIKIKAFKPQGIKNYYIQRYDERSTSSKLEMPDDRLQLLWMPDHKMINGANKLDFFTSDVAGEFEICLEGFLGNGKPVSVRKTFTVK